MAQEATLEEASLRRRENLQQALQDERSQPVKMWEKKQREDRECKGPGAFW